MMQSFSLTEALSWLGATAAGASLEGLVFRGVSTDTRNIGAGDLFVALRGENFDGHDYLAAAQKAGAVAAVVDKADPDLALPQILVPDTIDALAKLAAGNRNVSSARFVAITGSSGKTTVREMVAAILSRVGNTLATEGNLNNHIGVPLTLFRLAPEHEYGAIELGASGLNEIAHTVNIVRPDVSILTNAGQAHLEGFGGYDNIVLAKGEIIDGVAPSGLVVLNRDDPAFEKWQRRAGERRVVGVSKQAGAGGDYFSDGVRDDGSSLAFRACGPGGWACDVSLSLHGEHNITNALLAIAAARELGASDDAVQQGLASVQAVKGRLQILELSSGLTVIDDSYNANPASIKAALGVLAALPASRVAVLGAMAELGPDSLALHREVGEFARTMGIERLLVVGDGCEGYVEGFGDAAEVCATHDDAVRRLFEGPADSLTVLVKGSRSSAMDRVVEGIKEKVGNACCSG
ncbi:UDP-N-acetylmuramoyl-tripeptide--D-alanyl-D-alanine ligase [Marinobacter panjinensis]|uniref:UDP-N-acetylmuramoyl-tripeptide--D-alanyl-D-alanine ligase n=1 Tax=Marinobacter panjinensis TaxID=2576384 RepID=A0A4U6QTK0_9GAMM|nr:UDP-N-acetylmuramoyl-tripeptide--D-alanyl-D-alanine ligase [Marinobacter panjinensis]MCR8914756.1 UDP-N-acetylmuramoyl-tripeptide--D-alanyl-D-alanine ligase [Marinobacter panjinensis]TKV64011.1 UDP-N-acetylmuramoyl-tripeptide--D-alanyl-D-alanine ligase [Marinobacter panjinensis]